MAELFGIKWDDFKTALSSSFEILRKDNDFVDVTLISDDQKQFKGHKVVLSSCSPFFKEVFKANHHDHPPATPLLHLCYTSPTPLLHLCYTLLLNIL